MKLLQVLAVLTACYSAVLAKESMMDKFVEGLKKCNEDNPVPKDDIALMWRRTAPESQEGKCFLRCCMEHWGMLHDGELKLGIPKMILNMAFKDEDDDKEKEAKRVLEECADAVDKDGDRCEEMAKLMTCYFSQAPKCQLYDLVDNFVAMKEECAKDNEVTEGETLDMWQKREPESRNGKCYVACMMKKMGTMTEDGKINVDKEKEIVGTYCKDGKKCERAQEAAEKCAPEADACDDPCDSAAEYLKCGNKYMSEKDD